MEMKDGDKRLLEKSGYTLRVERQEKYPGQPKINVVWAQRGASEFIALPALPCQSRYERIRRVQDSIPHIARIVEILSGADLQSGVVVFEKAAGKMLWKCDSVPDIDRIEAQIVEFAAATEANKMIHGDIRPWNIFYDAEKGIKVIDWDSCRFIDELCLGDELLRNLANHGHDGHPLSDLARIDADDAARLVKLLRGQTGLDATWRCGKKDGCPPWCKR
jgi:hypothetical protein